MAWTLSQTLGIESYDSANNRTLYRTRVYLGATQYHAYAQGYNANGSGNVDGQAFSWTGPTAVTLNANQSVEIYTGTFWIYGDANGYRGSVGATVRFTGGGGYAPGEMSASASAGGFDFDRKPASPTFASVSRNIDSMTVALNTVSSPAGTPTYRVERRIGTGAWGDEKLGQSVTYTSLQRGVSHQFRARANNTDGYSAYTESQSYAVPTAPEAPSFINVTTPSGLSCTVTTGTAPNGGATVTSYSVQASPDDGTTWLPAVSMTSQSYTYTGLTPGANYKFRTFATNEMGAGSFATSPTVFVPAGGKRWNGTSWNPTATAKRWNGTAWVDLAIARRWNGTAWVDLS